MAVVCFKVVKHIATPSGAYFEYMLNLPETMKCVTVDATFLLADDPDTGMSTYQQKKGMTIEEYKAWLTRLVQPLKKMPKKLKQQLLMSNLHLL
jgi:hypothetical protein